MSHGWWPSSKRFQETHPIITLRFIFALQNELGVVKYFLFCSFHRLYLHVPQYQGTERCIWKRVTSLAHWNQLGLWRPIARCMVATRRIPVLQWTCRISFVAQKQLLVERFPILIDDIGLTTCSGTNERSSVDEWQNRENAARANTHLLGKKCRYPLRVRTK